VREKKDENVDQEKLDNTSCASCDERLKAFLSYFFSAFFWLRYRNKEHSKTISFWKGKVIIKFDYVWFQIVFISNRVFHGFGKAFPNWSWSWWLIVLGLSSFSKNSQLPQKNDTCFKKWTKVTRKNHPFVSLNARHAQLGEEKFLSLKQLLYFWS